MWDRFFTALASAKRTAAAASSEIVTRLGLPGVIIVLTGVASDGVNEQMVITIDADGGTWSINTAGDQAAGLAYDISAADLQTALRTAFGGNVVNVTGDAGGPWTVEFISTKGNKPLDPAQQLYGLDTSLLTKSGSASIDTVTPGTHTAAEADTQAITVVATSGTFKLTYSGQQTSALQYNATAAQVQAALEALSNIAPGDVLVTGGPGDIQGSEPYVITFLADGALAASDTGVTAQDVDLANTGRVDITRTVVGGPTANEKQTVALTGVTSGTFKITVLGEETAAIAYNASTSTMKTRLTDLTAFGSSDINVTGSAGAWVIEFVGAYANTAMDLMTVSNNSTVAADGITAGQLMVGIADPAAVNEVESVTIDATGGTFTLTYGGQETDPIAFDASAADVQAALEALSTIAVGDVIVSGPDGGPYLVEFSGLLRYTDVSTMSATGTALTNDVSGSVEESVVGEVPGTDLGYKVQVPDGDGGWTDYATVASALTDDGTDTTVIHPTATSADVKLPCPTEFRILTTPTGVWTYTITGQYTA